MLWPTHLLKVAALGRITYARGQAEQGLVLLEQGQGGPDALRLGCPLQHICKHCMRRILGLQHHSNQLELGGMSGNNAWQSTLCYMKHTQRRKLS